uniref:Uncharacterized protein n=1 Tax=Oryza punctata TaxID=4537 RepID=A0A0E0LIV1_ORYPU
MCPWLQCNKRQGSDRPNFSKMSHLHFFKSAAGQEERLLVAIHVRLDEKGIRCQRPPGPAYDAEAAELFGREPHQDVEQHVQGENARVGGSRHTPYSLGRAGCDGWTAAAPPPTGLTELDSPGGVPPLEPLRRLSGG